MRPHLLMTSAAALALAVTTLGGASAQGDSGERGRHHGHHGHHGHHHDLLRAPLAGSLVDDDAIFGVDPGAAPWEIGPSTVRVRKSGRLDLRVRGLLIPGVGVGMVKTVSASLACNGMIADTSKSVPLSMAGNARIRDHLSVPNRCLAPVVMVHPNNATAFFIAVSGHQR